MLKLQMMEIWNGRKQNACVFRYQVTESFALLSWCSSWDIELGVDVVTVWKTVALQCTRHGLSVLDKQTIDKQDIKSHGAAIREMKLDRQVIHPTSLGPVCPVVTRP